jgi:4-alpha-glucanotransferase
VFPLQDVLGLGSDARMNTPATLGNNWQWRFSGVKLLSPHTQMLREMAISYDRVT